MEKQAEEHQPDSTGLLFNETTGNPYPQDVSKEFYRHIEFARRKPGNQEFDALQAEGCAISVEQAVAYALGNGG